MSSVTTDASLLAQPPVPVGWSSLSSDVVLRFGCDDVTKRDALSQSDPFIVVYLADVDSQLREIGRTETATNMVNVLFAKEINVEYQCEEMQKLRLHVYDCDSPSEELHKHAILGVAVTTLDWGLVDHRAVQLEAVGDVHDALETVWQQQILGVMQRIWQWRHNLADEVSPWTATIAVSAARSSLLTAVHKATSGVDARSLPIVRGIVRGLVRMNATADAAPPAPDPGGTGHYLLFFDGGSRGNPGPGGAGAVIVQVDEFGSSERIVWSAAMSMAARTTTNNQAEYAGLVQGLRAAQANRWRPLQVIGDSHMIITQLRDSRTPKHPRLRKYYGQARLLADALGAGPGQNSKIPLVVVLY